ncbi:MAG: hypothetical protein LBJ99_01740 [Oscillospiraceae bacterium]|jgi:hypothetical protein|nr:hypothetical protein [Oscillospiraceae bacterium]
MDNCGTVFDSGSFANVWERVSSGREPSGTAYMVQDADVSAETYEADRLRTFIDGETERLRGYASLAARNGGETGKALRSLTVITKQWTNTLRAHRFVLTGDNYRSSSMNIVPARRIHETLRDLCALELRSREAYRKAATNADAETGFASLYARLENVSAARIDTLTSILGRIL